MREKLCILTMLLLVAGLLPSCAAPPSAPGLATAPLASRPAIDPVQTFINDPRHQKIVFDVAIDTFKHLQDCDSGTAQPTRVPENFASAGPLVVDTNGTLTSGLLKEPFLVTGCGKQRVENVLTLSDKGQVKSVAGMPGTTVADPVLVHDTFQYAVMGASSKIGQCKNIRFIDSYFDALEGSPNPRAKSQRNGGRGWRETWTMNACGKIVDTVIHYIPDETGTAISVAMN